MKNTKLTTKHSLFSLHVRSERPLLLSGLVVLFLSSPFNVSYAQAPVGNPLDEIILDDPDVLQALSESYAAENDGRAVAEREDRGVSLLEQEAAANKLLEDDAYLESIPLEVAEDNEPLESTQSFAEISADLKENLEAQFNRIYELEKTENAFSAKLGEEFLSYGLLLLNAGRIDEAREMVVDALHIAKVNNGVYAIEQRPMLRVLFDINLTLGNTEELEESLDKIIWIENRNPGKRDFDSLDLAIKLGHYFLDLYQIRGTKDEVTLSLLNKSARYFSYAVRQYGNAKLSEHLMPYGELALVHYYRSILLRRLRKDQSGFRSVSRDRQRSRQLNDNPLNDINRLDELILQSFSLSERYSNIHLRQAKIEQNQKQIVIALLALGDTNLLFKRKQTAAQYYRHAWDEAQKLPVRDPIVQSFDKPIRLPAFSFAIEHEEARKAGANYESLPVKVNIDANGKVAGVYKEVVGAPSNKIANKVRRIVGGSTFRPVIENGQLTAVTEHEEIVRVQVSKR